MKEIMPAEYKVCRDEDHPMIHINTVRQVESNEPQWVYCLVCNCKWCEY